MTTTGFIDPRDIDKLPPGMRAQAKQFLEQFPELANPPQAPAPITPDPLANQDGALDYSNFGTQPPPPPPQRKPQAPKMRIDPNNPVFANVPGMEYANFEQQEKAKEQAAQELKEKKAKDPLRPAADSFSPEGKLHPVLKKMRAVLGMDTLDRTESIAVAGVKYTMKALDNTKLTRALVVAAGNSLENAEYQLNIDTAVVSFSIIKIDEVPVYDVFSIPEIKDWEKDPITGGPMRMTLVERDFLAAQELFKFLKSGPPNVSDTLEKFYKQNFPSAELLDSGKVFAHCPEAGCQYSRIVDREGLAGFCPDHGKKLVKENELPNPS